MDVVIGIKDDTYSTGKDVFKTTEKCDNLSKEPSPLEEELEKLNARDLEKERIKEREFRREVKKLVEAKEKAKRDRGVELYPDIIDTKNAIRHVQWEEEYFALSKDREKLDAESRHLKQEIDEKFGNLLAGKRSDITSLAEKRFSRTRKDSEYPDHIVTTLTSEEIDDLKLVFGMFDMKGKGYITANDVKRIVGMLGFRAPKKVIDGMIHELAGEKGKVRFNHFLEFIVRSQGDGPDPYGEIKQAFALMDTKNQGYLSFEDLREVIDEAGLKISNRMLKQMIQDADKTGNGQITLDDFTSIMLQTSTFKFK